MIYDLPTSLEVNGRTYDIRSDFRDVLTILTAFEDPDLEPREKAYVCLTVLYRDAEEIPPEDLQEAYAQALAFIDNGAKKNPRGSARTIAWEQDAAIMFPAVNRAAGFEVRSVEYIHWWTFMGYFMEIKDSLYAHVLSIRHKKAKGKTLEKWEKDFWTQNSDICVIRAKLTEEEIEEKRRLEALLGQ